MNLSKPTKLSKHETVLIIIEDCTWLSVIPLVSAIQAYGNDAQKKHAAFCSFRKVEPDFSVKLDIIIPESAQEFGCLFPILIPEVRSIKTDIQRAPANYAEYDCIFDLSESKAREIGAPTQRHLAQSYGIMLGSEAFSLPDNVENICQGYTKSGKILTSFEFYRSIPGKVLMQLSDSMFWFRDAPLPLSERIRQVFECDGVMDVTSFETHLASCLKKPVLELSLDSALSKYSNPNYQCLTEMTEASLKKGLTVCFPSLLQQ